MFKVGDKVKMSDKCNFKVESGKKIGTIEYVDNNVDAKLIYRVSWIDGKSEYFYFPHEIESFEWSDDILKEKFKKLDEARLAHILEDPYGEENWCV